MTNVEEALTIVLENAIRLPAVKLPLEETSGKILREPLLADRDFPPYNRVTMDGIALAFDDFAAGQRTFPIVGVGAAGAPQQSLLKSGSCLEIMTGAMLPEGTDTVIRYEDLAIEGQQASVQIDAVRKGQNIHRQGEDRKKGDRIVPAGQMISAAEIGVAATIGKSRLEVSRPVTALILSSGDELVEIRDTPLPHQIRKSNVYTIRSVLERWGVQVEMAHVPDDQAEIEKLLGAHLTNYDVLLLSGGVSKGKFDYIPEALESLGVERYFHRVAQRPGKPFWFGRIPDSTVVFALPGNPVSSLVCTLVYFGAWLRASWGIREGHTARLAKDVAFRPDLNYFVQVRLESDDSGVQQAFPVEGHGSGDLANLVDVDAFLMLPRGKDHFRAGEAYRVWKFR